MAIKVAIFVLLMVLVAYAQNMGQPRDISSSRQDPIGNYRLRVRGFLVGGQGGQPIANLQGYTERLRVHNFQTTLCHTILQVEHQGGQRQQEMPVINLNSFERPDSIDFFANPSTGMDDIGSCFFATVDSQRGNLEVSQWQKARTKCGSSKNGELWTRTVSFSDEAQRQLESTEAICKGQDGRILWLETSQKADGQQIYATRLEVEDYGSEPTVNQQGLASFSLPAVCIVQPEETKNAAELLVNALSAMGIDLGGGHGELVDRENRENIGGGGFQPRGGRDDVVREPFRGNEQRRPLQN